MLNIENINIVAGKFRVQNFSLRLQEGLCHVLVGTTGSGKTLLLETIAGLRRQESGIITFADRNISHLEPELRNVSYLPQDLCLFPNMLVRENICYGLRMKGIGAAEAARRLQPLAVSLDIAHLLDRHVDHLSGGEKQRTALARTLISDNPMVLLDEPFSSLNLGLKRKLWHLLKKMQREQGWTLLLVTHDLEEALLLGDDLSLIANGMLVDSGPKNQVYCYPKTVSAACILGTENFLPGEFVGRSDGLCNFHCPDFPANLSVSASYPTLAGDNLDKLRFKLGIKAADIKLCRPDSAGAGAVGCCSIEAIHEKGRTATLVLRSKTSNLTMLAEVSLKELAGHVPGDEVGISISPEAIMALVEK
ncbi:MAG: hypothetical protein A2W80_03310 [Candidatus Riflebacteria bacterium GWC2_50_8]|nr:MAG: hypothetical protein A2W80_03310 [Candidatus Riflebacteria bacterium GWC2_50_8]